MSAPGYSLCRDYLLWLLVAALLAFSIAAPARIPSYPSLVDWPTLATLGGLLLLTAGIEESGALQHLAVRILHHVRDERRLALFLITTALVSSALFTNDIALFILVPLTLSLGRHATLPLRRLVVFEALAVNTGSMLTPIGNPQNIFLWLRSGAHIHEFILAMAPPFLIAGACLFAFTWAGFRPRTLHLEKIEADTPLDRMLLAVSASLFAPFLAVADMHEAGYALLAVGLIFAAAFRRVLRGLDWPLLLVFLLMFVDLRLLAGLSWVQGILNSFDLHRPVTLYLSAAFLSQAMSNVPATILLSQYTTDWRTLAWGVDVGGFGLVVGSLANLIALRLGRQPGSLGAFHAWSLPFFGLSLALTALWLHG
ncbi:MAG: SLC13 family permease [Bacillota bacterium]